MTPQALVVAFSTGGFWPVVEPLLDQAAVYYTGDALLVFEARAPGWKFHGLAYLHGQLPGRLSSGDRHAS